MTLPPSLRRMLEEEARAADRRAAVPTSVAAVDSEAEPEFKRRRELPRRRRRGALPAIAALLWRGAPLLPVGALAGWLLAGPALVVRDVELTGNHRVDERWVDRELDDLRGRNLLLLSLPEVERRLLEHRWVHSVALRKHLPGRLSIALSEHRPVAALEVGASWFAVTAAGVSVGRLEAEEAAALLPLRTRALRVPLHAPAHDAAIQAAVRGALEVVAELEAGRPDLRAGLVGVGLLSPDDFELRWRDRPYAVLVERGLVLARWQLFERLQAQLLERYGGLLVVDLRFEKRLVLEPAPPPAAPLAASDQEKEARHA